MKSKNRERFGSSLLSWEKTTVKCSLSIFLAVLGELFGIGPFLMVAVLADALYRGTATPKLVLFLCGGAAVCQIIKMLLTWRSSLMSHKISFTILKNIREAITGRMAKIPMGVMLETPTGAFKNLIVDNVAKVDFDKCVACGAWCGWPAPRNIIRIVPLNAKKYTEVPCASPRQGPCGPPGLRQRLYWL